MAILHIKQTGGGFRRRAAMSSVAIAIGVVLGWMCAPTVTRLQPTASMSAHVAHGPARVSRSEQFIDPVTLATERIGAAGFLNTESPAKPSPAQLQTQARLFADCQEREARRVNGVLSELEESYAVDPSGALALAYRDDEQRRTEQCRGIGVAEFRQIESMMEEAARHGEPSARLFLIERTLHRLTEGAAEARTFGETNDAAVQARTAQAEASVHDLEQLALQGWLPAMKALGDGVLVSDLLLPTDPVRAAAWNLIASRSPGDDTALSLRDVEAGGSLMPRGSKEDELVLREARQLREACCGDRARGVSRRLGFAG